MVRFAGWVALSIGCAHRPIARDAPPTFGPAEPWAEPIADYLARGAAAHPEGFNRAITTLTPFDGRLWLGYGDATLNLGTPAPIELRYFASPDDPVARAAPVVAEGQGAPQRTPTDSGEEQIEPFRVLGDELWLAGVDSNDPDELWTQSKPAPAKLIEGNVFVLRAGGEPTWQKLRTIPGGEHVHDITRFDGSLWAVGSGSKDRVEWEAGEIFRTLWRSDDSGTTFTVARRDVTPDPGRADTRYRRLLVSGDTLFVFGYVNPFVDGGALVPHHVALRGGVFADLQGPIAAVVVQRTFPLGPWGGLVVERGERSATRTFLVRDGVFTELGGWSGRRVVDVATENDGSMWVLAGDGADPEAFAVYRASAEVPDLLLPSVPLGTTPCTAVARWGGDLFVGTADGKVLRARATR